MAERISVIAGFGPPCVDVDLPVATNAYFCLTGRITPVSAGGVFVVALLAWFHRAVAANGSAAYAQRRAFGWTPDIGDP